MNVVYYGRFLNIFFDFIRIENNQELVDDLQYSWIQIKEIQKKKFEKALRSRKLCANLNISPISLILPLSKYNETENTQLVAFELGTINSSNTLSNEISEQCFQLNASSLSISVINIIHFL